MASLTAKVVRGRTYYYLRECQRVDGKPKIVKTIYLGTLKKLLAVAPTASLAKPQTVAVSSFGAVAALLALAQQLDLVGLIDQHVPKRRQGLSVGQYLLLAAINRAVHPTSKTQLADWYRHTVLTRLVPATADQLSSQAFWNHMNAVSEANIQAIEHDLSQRLVTQFDICLRSLTYDGTNFFTYLNTKNPAELPQRGHNKQKRGDLRQVSLGLLVSTDFHVPLFHKVYAGNVPDTTAFQTITEELRQRYAELARTCEHITLIFDKGNNSSEAFQTLDDTNFHFIGSLVPSHHADLLEVPLRRYTPLSDARLADGRAYRTRRLVFGQERTVVVTHNDNLLHGQLQGVTANLDKTRTRLREIRQALQRRAAGKVKGGKKPTVATVRKQVQQALTRQFMKTLFHYDIQEVAGVPTLIYETDKTALARLIRIQLGKTILFTDNDDWSTEEIVLGYRSQYHIENAFRQMKDPHFLGWMPMFHWTDSKIRVHAFTCVLALLLSSLLQRTLHQQGVAMSIPALFELLGDIQEAAVIYPRSPGQRHPTVQTCLTPLSAEQETLLDKLKLRPYLPQ
jgi:transposase